MSWFCNHSLHEKLYYLLNYEVVNHQGWIYKNINVFLWKSEFVQVSMTHRKRALSFYFFTLDSVHGVKTEANEKVFLPLCKLLNHCKISVFHHVHCWRRIGLRYRRVFGSVKLDSQSPKQKGRSNWSPNFVGYRENRKVCNPYSERTELISGSLWPD